MGKLTGVIAATALMAGMSDASSKEAPEILSAAAYQAMSKVEMSSITGESNHNINTNINIVVCTPTPNCEVSSSSVSTTEEHDGIIVNTNTNVNFASAVDTSE
jgi:hypothetical protein